MVAFSAARLTHKLLVLKYLYLLTFWNSFSSSSGHCALSRSSSPPVAASAARWPPFLSASVRAAHSIANGLPEPTNHVSSLRSIVAPKLSELETNMYLYPFSSRVARLSVPSIAGYRSPCPGGHHSQSGLVGQAEGDRSVSVTLGALFCWNSSGSPSVCSESYLERYSSVSAEVAKEFISMKASGTP